MTRSATTKIMMCMASAVLASAGCQEPESSSTENVAGSGDTGRILLAITSAPPDAACLRLSVKGATSVVRNFPLMPMAGTNLVLDGLPLGQVVFTGEAFSVTCAQVGTETVATWVSDAVAATLTAGQTVAVSIALQRPGKANVAVDFPTMPPPMCDGTPGEWSGCRGNGCAVCAEKLVDYPRYFINHPGCMQNDTCAGVFGVCNAACPAPTDADRNVPVMKYFEAEAGFRTAPMVEVTDMAASGGKAVWSGTANSTGGVPTDGHISFTFMLLNAKVYKVWGRFLVGPQTTSDDSLWVRIDQGAWTQWNNLYQKINSTTAYGWVAEHDSAMMDAPVTYNLKAGGHTLEVAYRENGLKMDRFLITDDLMFVPSP